MLVSVRMIEESHKDVDSRRKRKVAEQSKKQRYSRTSEQQTQNCQRQKTTEPKTCTCTRTHARTHARTHTHTHTHAHISRCSRLKARRPADQRPGETPYTRPMSHAKTGRSTFGTWEVTPPSNSKIEARCGAPMLATPKTLRACFRGGFGAKPGAHLFSPRIRLDPPPEAMGWGELGAPKSASPAGGWGSGS